MPLDDYLPLNAASTFLREHVPANESAMIFPFENIEGNLARRRVAGGVEQNYIVSGPFLRDQQFKGLERDHPNWAIYSVDGLGSWPIDGVPNFTRTPEVWFYLQRHFHRVANLELGVLGLQRDEERMQRWNMDITPWQKSPVYRSVEAGKNIQLAELNSPPPQDLDFIRLKIQIRYPMWWRVLKPASVSFFLQRSDKTTKVVRAIVQPNHPYEIWIYPWSEYQLMNYFFEDSVDWHKRGTRTFITNISARCDRQDWLSVLPSQIELDGVDAIHVSLR